MNEATRALGHPRSIPLRRSHMSRLAVLRAPSRDIGDKVADGLRLETRESRAHWGPRARSPPGLACSRTIARFSSRSMSVETTTSDCRRRSVRRCRGCVSVDVAKTSYLLMVSRLESSSPPISEPTGATPKRAQGKKLPGHPGPRDQFVPPSDSVFRNDSMISKTCCHSHGAWLAASRRRNRRSDRRMGDRVVSVSEL